MQKRLADLYCTLFQKNRLGLLYWGKATYLREIRRSDRIFSILLPVIETMNRNYVHLPWSSRDTIPMGDSETTNNGIFYREGYLGSDEDWTAIELIYKGTQPYIR